MPVYIQAFILFILKYSEYPKETWQEVKNICIVCVNFFHVRDLQALDYLFILSILLKKS